MILLLLAGAGPWTPLDEAELAPARQRAGFSEGMRPLELGSERVPAEQCGACHEAEYREWRDSRHSQSATNAIFTAGFEAEPTIRCVRCHAPLREQAEPFARHLRARRLGPSTLSIPPDSPANEGIGCSTCHVRDGAILTARPIETPEHPTRYEPLLTDARFCAGCHQFRFERGRNLTDHVTQDTWREWRASSTKDCRACHMDRGSHRFPGAHDAQLTKSALDVRTQGRVLELTARNIGHRFPTGDLFRHLLVQAEIDGRWITLARLGRTFEVVREEGAYVKRMIADDTLRPGEPRRVRMPQGDRWRVLYAFTRDDSETTVIASGDFPSL
jgi:hypothetical protein